MWHYLYIDDPKKHPKISEDFMDKVFWCNATESHTDAAVFSRFDSQTGGAHYHFTPKATAVAVKYGATSCDQPLRENLGKLLSGEFSIVDRLY